MRSSTFFGSLGLLGIMLLAGCGDDETGACTSIAGTWQIEGACGADLCTISQSGCATTFSCDAARGTSGSVSGNDVQWSGETVTGVPGTCSGSASGGSMSGTCDVSGAMCDFTATRVSGADSGTPPMDSGAPPSDSGTPPVDSGAPPDDAGAVDSGTPDVDAGTPPDDAGAPPADASSACTSVAGNWGITGTCGADTCVITQTGCATMFSCGSGTRSYTGTVSGDTATWRAMSGTLMGTCTAAVSGAGFSGTCLLDVGATCTVMGTRLP